MVFAPFIMDAFIVTNFFAKGNPIKNISFCHKKKVLCGNRSLTKKKKALKMGIFSFCRNY